MATYTGTAESESLAGSSSDDTLTGLLGNDTIVGGEGIDTVVYQGNREDYVITRAGNTFTINDTVSGRDQTDTVSEVEYFQFADFTVKATNQLTKTWLSDFNGDGQSDFYWVESGGIQIWSYDEATGSTETTWSTNSFGDPSGYQAIISIDFLYNDLNDGDFTVNDDYGGNGVKDIVNIGSRSGWGMDAYSFYRHQNEWEFASWRANLNTTTGDRTYSGVGDFNNDGREDILFRLNSGANQQIEVLTNALSGGNAIERTVVSGIEEWWETQGIGDMNGDGNADLLFRNANTGDIVQWNLDGGELISSAYLGNPGTTWDITGFHDFDGNGTDDILFRNNITGDVVQWATFAEGITGSIFGNVGNNWELQGVGDFNGDGREDLLWKNVETNMVVDWLMDGSTSSGQLLTESLDSTKTFQGIGDYNGDGKADVVWRDSATSDVVVWFMDGGSFSQYAAGTIGSGSQLVSG